jgi:hypothetical protein
MVRARAVVVFGLCMSGAGCAALVDLGDPKKAASTDDGGPPPTLQAQAIAVAASHACAVVKAAPESPENGTIRCWGANDSGQLGTDPQVVPASSTPVAVAGRQTPEQANVATLALGTSYSCAITLDAYLLCWGLVPYDSEVFPQEDTPAYEPSVMLFATNPLDVTNASVTDTGGCCTRPDVSLLCWGPEVTTSTSADGGVTKLDGGVSVDDQISKVAIGRAHACAIAIANSSDTDVECWGINDRGQAGSPSPARVTIPQRMGIGPMGAIDSVYAGGDDSCALLVDGRLFCWGAGDRGQLGLASPSADSSTPVPIAIPSPTSAKPKAIAVGDGHVCARLEDTTVWCWGDNSSSQLGEGPGGPASSPTPVQVYRAAGNPPHPLSYVTNIAAGGRTTCATSFKDGHAWCWGANESGQAGQSGAAPVPYATPVTW